MSDLRVALTFDAEHPSRPHCPPGATAELLAALTRAEVKATFFLQGRWVTAYQDAARSIVRAGHVIGNHSHYHARFSDLSLEGVREDLGRAEGAIRHVTGTDPRPWFRFPFGDADQDPDVAATLADLGYRHVGWHVDPNDWDPARTIEDLERVVVGEALAHGDGAVVLLHAWPATTPEAVARIIPRLRAEGALLVGVDELDDLPSAAIARPY